MPTTHPRARARAWRVATAGAVAVIASAGATWPATNATPLSLDAGSRIEGAAAALQPADRLSMDTSKPIFPMQAEPYCYASDSFGDARSGGRVHQGMDIMADPKLGPTQAVYAVVDGTLAGQVLAGADNATLSGNTWGLRSASGTTYYVFMHLSRFADGLANGSAVSQGQIIGWVGDTGNPGPGNYHLHFEIHPAGARTAAVDPYPLVPIPSDCR